MTQNTNVPALQITETGVVVPETGAVLAGVLQDYNAAFGGGLNIENVATPQGYLAQETTANIVALQSALAFLFSSVDPAYASGRMQDAIARIYFIARKAATHTTVTALCTGAPGVTLPAGSQAKDTNGNTYTSAANAVFDPSGQAEVIFQCDTPGPIPCGIGQLTQILIAVPGWDAITNEVAGIAGNPVENREDFERRRFESVALNATDTNAAILANVFNLEEVTDCYVIENPTGQTVTKGATNYSLLPHSIYIAVVGGNDQEVAEKIFQYKNPGCDMNGNTTVTVYDSSALVEPYPEYQIKFNRPTPVPIHFVVTIQNNNRLPANVIQLVKSAIVSAFNGKTTDMDRERMASNIFASKYYSVISAISSQINILSVLIGTETADKNALEMGIDQYPTISEDHISVVLQ